MLPYIQFRLVLAKKMYKQALRLCATPTDSFSFSQGLIALHDSLDNFLGAIATKIGVPLQLMQRKNSLMQTFQEIETFEKATNPSFVLDNRSEISHLNTIRNDIKHQGIIPNINQALTLINPINLFFEKYCLRYFGLNWRTISLADLIKKEEICSKMKVVEKLIETHNYKEALNSMAIIKFKVFEESILRIELDNSYDLILPPSKEREERRKSENIFPKEEGYFSDFRERIKFLEIGIDLRYMNEFERLTAKVGFNNNKEWKYVLNHDRNWSSTNWTHDISIYCFDFLIDCILKNQEKYPLLKNKSVSNSYTFIAKEEIKIFDKNNILIYTISKDQTVEDSFLPGRIDRQWEIFDPHDLMISFSTETDTPDQSSTITGFLHKESLKDIELVLRKEYRDENGGLALIYEGNEA